MKIAAGGDTPIGLPKKYSNMLMSAKSYKHYQNIFKTFFKRFLYGGNTNILKELGASVQKEVKKMLDLYSQSFGAEMPSFASINEGGGKKYPKNLANPPPLMKLIMTFIISFMLVLPNLYANNFPKIDSAEFRNGKIDSWLSVDKNTAIKIDGEKRKDTVFVNELWYSKIIDVNQQKVKFIGELEFEI